MVDEAIKPEAITKIQGWIKEKGLRPAAIKVVDWCLYRKCGMTSGDMPDTSEFANGVDEVEDQLKNQHFQGALDAAKETANDMIQAAKDEIGESKHKPELKVARYGKEFWIIQDGHKMTGPYADTDTAEKELSKIKESKDPEMDFHYVKGYISDMIKNWDVVTSRANALDNLKQKLSTILNAMNESQGASFGKTAKLNWNQVEKYLNDNYLKFDEIVTTNDGLKLFYSTIKGENRHVATFNTKTGELFYGVNVKESVNENRYLKLIHNLLYKVEQLIKKMKAKGQLDGDSTVLDALQDWAEEVYAMGMSESKVNEEEALMGNNATTAAPAPQDVSQVPEEPVADKPATPTPEPLEKAGPVKEYLGNNGSDTYFYLVVVSGDEGTPKELQITDANEEVIYTTKDSNLNVEDIAGFIKSAIKEKEIANISTDLMDKYLFPAEAPVVDVAQEEEKPETEMPQAEDVPHQPAMESLLKKFDLVDIKEGLGDAIQNYNRKLGELENALAVFVKDPKIREWLKKNDPQALEQAEEALDKPLKENLVDIKWNIFCLMEKFGLIETNMEKLLEKYKLAEVFSINDDETVKEEVPVVEEPVQPGVEKPVIDANGKEQVPDNMTGPATDSDVDAPVDIPTTPEEARTKIQLEYPEEPFTSLAMAYADSMIDDPAVYKPIRQLQYEGIWVNADTFKKLAKVVGELNSFDGSATAEMLIGKFKGDSSKYRISRDNSVVIDIVVRDMQAKHSLEAIKDLVNASSVEDKGDGNVQIKF